MKVNSFCPLNEISCVIAMAVSIAVGQPQQAAALEKREGDLLVTEVVRDQTGPRLEEAAEEEILPGGGKHIEKDIIIRRLDPLGEEEAPGKEIPWLGVATEEAPEALTSQLSLSPGVGLVVTFVTPDSPAAKAGLQKNDVLVQFAGQDLVHPTQLRKLVRVRKEGESVPLVIYRGGKQQTLTAVLGKTKTGEALLFGDRDWQKDFKELQRQFKDLPIRETIREQMKTLRDSMGNLKIDQQKVQEELRKSLEEARKAVERAMRDAKAAASDAAGKALREVGKSDVRVDDNATVTVRSSGNDVKSTVVSDDSGTLVIVANPTPHLTAHDKQGKLVFDGEIGTEEQQERVPRELWSKVEPLLDKMQKEK